MTIEQIKAEIVTKENAIEILSNDIRDLQQQWMALSDIKVGDKVKMTNIGYDKREYERIGIVNNIDISWDGGKGEDECGRVVYEVEGMGQGERGEGGSLS